MLYMLHAHKVGSRQTDVSCGVLKRQKFYGKNNAIQKTIFIFLHRAHIALFLAKLYKRSNIVDM
jgi:hypothetical protein